MPLDQSKKLQRKAMNDDDLNPGLKSIRTLQEFDSVYDENLFSGDEDRLRLLNLQEFQRETILATRSDVRTELYERFKAKEYAEPTDVSRKASERQTEMRGKRQRNEALEDLVRQRREKRLAEDEDEDEKDADSHLEDGEIEEDISIAADSASEEVSGLRPISLMDASAEFPEEKMSYDDLKTLQVKREQLEKWIDMPYFDKIVGLYARVQFHGTSLKNVYQVCRIDGITEGNTIRIYPDGFQSKKVLALRYGEDIAKTAIKYVSNSEFREEEYKAWEKECSSNRFPFPTASQAKKLKKTVSYILGYKLNEEELQRVIEGRNRNRGSRTPNLTKSRIALSDKLEIARQNGGSPEEIAALEGELSRLLSEAARSSVESASKSTSSLSSLEAINVRNRIANLSSSSTPSFRNIRNYGASGAGDAKLDPFTRRSTVMSEFVHVTENTYVPAAQKQQERERLKELEKKKKEEERLRLLELAKPQEEEQAKTDSKLPPGVSSLEFLHKTARSKLPSKEEMLKAGFEGYNPYPPATPNIPSNRITYKNSPVLYTDNALPSMERLRKETEKDVREKFGEGSPRLKALDGRAPDGSPLVKIGWREFMRMKKEDRESAASSGMDLDEYLVKKRSDERELARSAGVPLHVYRQKMLNDAKAKS